MISLKLKLKDINQFNEFSKTVNFIFQKNKELLQPEEYFHYFNMRSLIKKNFDKSYKTTYTYKKIAISINVNEFESLKYVYFLDTSILEEKSYTYNKIIFLEAIAILDKQSKNFNLMLN